MDDFDTLMQEAEAFATEATRAKEARKQLSRHMNLDKGDKEELQNFVKNFENQHLWFSTSQVLLFQRQRCSCGATHLLMEGQFLRQAHRQSKHNQRLIPNTWPLCNLPRAVEYLDSSVNLCANCAGEQGFDVFPL